MRRFWMQNKLLTTVNILAIFVDQLVMLSVAFLIQYIIDATTSGLWENLLLAGQISFIYLLVFLMSSYARKLSLVGLQNRFFLAIKNSLIDSLLRKDISKIMHRNSSFYVSIINNDLKTIEEDYFRNIITLIGSSFAFSIDFIMLLYINPFIALVSFLLTIPPLIIPRLFSAKLSKRKEIYLETMALYISKLKDYFTGFEVIKSFGIESRISDNHKTHNRETETSKRRMFTTSTHVDVIANICAVLMEFMVMLVSGYYVIAGDITLGVMMAIVQLAGMLVSPIKSIPTCIAGIKSTRSINAKILDIIDDTGQDPVVDHAREYKISEFTQSLRLEDVSFSYDGKNSALKNVTYTFEKGKKYALVGSSGSGKSTLLRLMLAYYQNYTGDIYLDERNIKTIDINYLNRLFSIIHQNVFIFEDTLRNNITLYRDYPESEINRAVADAGLSGLVDTLSDGLLTVVREGGNNLSGGEKQRICIARALLGGVDFLLLDEATSSLDNQAAYDLEKRMLSLPDITCITVTHRFNPELLKEYDAILVMRNGCIVESGTFTSLMDINGLFYSLYSIQS